MSESSFYKEKMNARVDHAAEATRIIAEYFSFEERATEEEKLLSGLDYGVRHGILTEDEREQCLHAFLETRNGTQGPQAPQT